MFDLKERVQGIIDNEIASNKLSLLEHDHSDSFSYYENEIINDFLELKELESVDKDKLLNYINMNQESLLEYISSGFPYAKKGFFGIGSIGEIEIDISYYPLLKHRKAINQFTDLYVSDSSNYAYINCNYDYIALNLNKINLDELSDY